MYSALKNLTCHSIDPIIATNKIANKCTDSKKLNLCIGVLRTWNNSTKTYVPHMFSSVKKSMDTVIKNNDYCNPTGKPEFCNLINDMIIDNNHNFKNCSTIQSISGTGGLYLTIKFLKSIGFETIYYPENGWPIYKSLIDGINLKSIPFTYDPNNVDKMFYQIYNLINSSKYHHKSALLFQTVCHNPSGLDLSAHNWNRLAHILSGSHVPIILDNAYMGLSSGNIKNDLLPIHTFFKHNIDTLVVSSFAKTMGLYGQRTGALTSYLDPKLHKNFTNHMQYIIRNTYSNPPRFGADVAVELLTNHKQEWEQELAQTTSELNKNKQLLYNNMKYYNVEPEHDFSNSKGLFALTGLTEQETIMLYSFGIFMPPNGRINVSGLTESSINYIVESIIKVRRQQLFI